MTIFNYKDKNIDFDRSIAFKNEPSLKMTIKISEDFTKTVLGSMEENYCLSINEKPNPDGSPDYVQKIINLNTRNTAVHL